MINNNKFISAVDEDLVSYITQNETGKRQYYRPVYSLHKWWARRPGALFRSIILKAANSDEDLFKTTPSGSISKLSNYFKDHNLENKVILDPFMGGGTTLVEANRLGAKVIGCDLNPVSFWIVRETLKPIDLEKLDTYFEQLELDAGNKIKHLYLTNCTQCQSKCNSLYVFWLRFTKCQNCERNAYLFKRTLLNKGISRNKPPLPDNLATTFCPNCFELNDWDGIQNCECASCGHIYDPTKGTYNQGYYSCSQCGEGKFSLLDSLKSGEKLHEMLLAIEYWCDCCNERLYKSPDNADNSNIIQIHSTFEDKKESIVFPRQRILEGASSVRWRLHNYRYYFEVFNSRQLVAFNFLIEGIRKIPEIEYQNALFTVFSNSLEYNNMMTPYNYPHRKLHHLFNYHAMPLTTTPVENVVWGTGSDGAGTFVNCYKRYVNAKNYCYKPFDKYKDPEGVVQTIYSNDEKISANLVSSFDELLKTPRGTFLLCDDSSELPSIPKQSVDFVITDPPYLDSIHYSELSNFFYVWLKCLIDNPHFKSEHVPTENEAIVNKGMNKGEQDYLKLLSAVFRESERVLKDDGKLIFTFHHSKWQAWWIVVQAIMRGGFNVVDSFPVMSEYKVNPHIRNKQAMDMDLVLVCSKKTIPITRLSVDPSEILERTLEKLHVNELSLENSKIFLSFMGELMKTASSVSEDEIDYHWFASSLIHFDDFITTVNIMKINDQRLENAEAMQLRLLDGSSADDSPK